MKVTKNKVIPMSEEFSTWYRVVSLDSNPEVLQKRWAGVSALTKVATWKEVEGMICLLFNPKNAPMPSELDSIYECFQDADELFDPNENARELEILCGATLSSLCHSDKDIAAATALGIITAASVEGRKPSVPVDLVKTANKSLIDLSERNRQRPDLDRLATFSMPSLDLEEVIEKVRENNLPGALTAISSLGEATQDSLADFQKQISSIVTGISKFLAVQDEELQMLAWLTGGRSWELGCAFNEIEEGAKPLVLAKDLARVTTFLPSRPSARALLARAGLNEVSEISIPEAVNACSIDWIKTIIPSSKVSHVILPIHFAMNSKIDTGDDTSWISYWSARTGLSSSAKISSLTLGYQFYMESLLASFIKDEV